MNLESNDRYRIIRKLGDGGMGEVYLVEHMLLGRKEALKILHQALAKSPQFISRFRREARALNRLKHTNIVCVYDFGTLSDGRFYLSAEYADGENLRDILKSDGALPIARAIPLLVQLASAVAHAHSRGVIHRDLKPENLILEKDHRGRTMLKVLDFGIAKIVARDYQDSVEITKLGSIHGTPQYMSPEQVRGEGNDPRIDIYAIGCIAFELAVGVPPFRGASHMDIMHAQVYDSPPRFDRQRGGDQIPDAYEQIVRRCLSKDPESRPQTGNELMEALEKIPGYARNPEVNGSWPYSRKSQPILLHTRPLVLDSSDFEDEETIEDSPQLHMATQQLQYAHSKTMPLTDVPATAEVVAIELAEHILGLGCDDSSLSIQLCLVQEMQFELEQVVDEIDELEERRTQVEQRAKHSEATLRFSIGELRYESDRAKEKNEDIDARVEPHINSLEQRLAKSTSSLRNELRDISDKIAELERACIDRENALDRALEELRQTVIDLTPDYTATPYIMRLLTQLKRVSKNPGIMSH